MNIKTLFLGLISAACLASCSNIADDDRLIFVEHRDFPGGDDDFTPTVLIEDFTGQQCTYCPSGTRVINEAIELYGEDKVIPVAIHCGLAIPEARGGLMNALGMQYYENNGKPSQPAALFNRTTLSNQREDWLGLAYANITNERDVALITKTLYDAATRTVTVEVKAKARDGKTVNGKLQLWLTESNIIGRQIDNGTNIPDYVHNHVLRDAVNGAEGEDISLTNNVATITRTYTIPEKYVAENCEIVAFVYNAAGVQQASKAKVMEIFE